ncbi:hypothetical protein BH23CHL5_BH23CHL5_12760 [soil metagenome]
MAESARVEADRDVVAGALRSSMRDGILAVFGKGGVLEAEIAGFEFRTGQQELATAIAAAFLDGEVLVAEAGTGIGKSLAYLIPAALWTQFRDEPVIISTHTRALQDQLLKKDIPLAVEVMANIGSKRQLNAVALKGRSNYLCRDRWQAELGSRAIDEGHESFLVRLKEWASTTQTGDKTELSLSSADDHYFQRISASSENCASTTCRAKHGSRCFLTKARTAAQRADIVIVNHALLFSGMDAGGAFLPETSSIVIDEAHHLESAATSHFSSSTSLKIVTDHVDALASMSGSTASGILSIAIGSMASSGVFVDSPEDGTRALQTLRHALNQVEVVHRIARNLFQALGDVVWNLADDSQRNVTLRILPSTRKQPAWSQVEQITDDLLTALRLLRKNAEWVSTRMARDLQSGRLGDQGELTHSAIVAWLESELRLEDDVHSALLNPVLNTVCWLQQSGRGESVSVHSSLLDPGPRIFDSLFATRETVVLTSATLRTGGAFTHFRKQTGIVEAQEVVIPSPFDYRQNALIVVAKDVPEPNQAAYDQTVSDVVVDLARAIKGRTLVLFTSLGHLRATANSIRTPLAEIGIETYAQWSDGTPEALAARLRVMKPVVVLGAASMWEGIDVPGPGLSALVVVRLPFDVPSDPLHSARAELFDSPFSDYSVPRATLKLRQGFGRLIRSSTDRGVVVLLDRRIVSKGYGQSFLKALPDTGIALSATDEIGETVKAWLDRQAVSESQFGPGT